MESKEKNYVPKVCPFCGKKPMYNPQTELVRCETPDCAISDWYIHITEWNRRYNEEN